MADEIEDDGPSTTPSYYSKATTTLQNSSHASASRPSGQRPSTTTSRPQVQPSLDRQNGAPTGQKSGIVQPKPQALPKRSGPSAILVSPRQKGNSVLEKIKAMPWEWAEIPADYVLGVTTCALFLSLKYHRIKPEYIYNRIKGLQGKYLLRILLVMVDIDNHEDSLKELTKTSLINNVTIILCWSAAEGARYLELFKTYENAAPTSIKQHQSTTFSDRMVDFVTTPRSVNKTDAVSLVSQFGTLRTAVNARHEEVSGIPGWGEKKVQQWCGSVSEPFRIKRAAKRGINLENLVSTQPLSRGPTLSRDVTRDESEPPAADANRLGTTAANADADQRPNLRLAEEVPLGSTYEDDEEALAEAMAAETMPSQRKPSAPATSGNDAPEAPKKRKQNDDPLNDGIMAALNKLRKT